MSVEYITKIIRIEVSPTQKLILFALANYSDQFGQSYPSHEKLTEITGLSLTAVKDNLKKLIGSIEEQSNLNQSNANSKLIENKINEINQKLRLLTPFYL